MVLDIPSYGTHKKKVISITYRYTPYSRAYFVHRKPACRVRIRFFGLICPRKIVRVWVVPSRRLWSFGRRRWHGVDFTSYALRACYERFETEAPYARTSPISSAVRRPNDEKRPNLTGAVTKIRLRIVAARGGDARGCLCAPLDLKNKIEKNRTVIKIFCFIWL